MDWVFEKTHSDKKYNCVHFITEVWNRCLGLEVSELEGLMTGRASRSVDAHKMRVFFELGSPVDWAMCLFQARRGDSHVGIFLDNRVLHLTKTGTHWVDLSVAMLGFNRVRFYGIESYHHR